MSDGEFHIELPAAQTGTHKSYTTTSKAAITTQ